MNNETSNYLPAPHEWGFHEQREVLCDWLHKEGFNPADVPARPDAIIYNKRKRAAGILVIDRDESGGIVVEDNGVKVTRKWASVSSPPPAPPQNHPVI